MAFDKLYYKGKEVKIAETGETIVLTVPTPQGWKCKVRKCPIKIKHKHIEWLKLNEK